MAGMRPTGGLHLGHFLGVLSQWKDYCDTADAYFLIADLHAYTTSFDDPQKIRDARNEMVACWLAAGVDPKKSTIYLQSAIPEITELHTLLSMIVPVSWLERVPTWKGQIEELGSHVATYGFLGYPLLQVSDIVTMRGQLVPVGRDQVAHIEFAREVVRRFNHLYGGGEEILLEPQPTLTEFAEVPGTDGRKMSKSYNNFIAIADDEETTNKKIKTMFTDPQKLRKNDPGRPEVCPVFTLWKYAGPERLETIAAGCRSGELGCVADKTAFAEALNEKLRPTREKYAMYMSDQAQVEAIIAEGSERAREVASGVVAQVKRAMKLL